ncbi:hypothetical protein [Ochrobactrum sp. BTU1]|uniref:hypothetical protein n=1 Tax=Ochrobactrum sp. BTU1 TaxID=2840456 RepID=UPI001C052CCB|nr:hypothetical protein KMS41_26200 [Ochrobactrum sp. BTU1]
MVRSLSLSLDINMPCTPAEMIDWLIINGHANDLLAMMRGENEYADIDYFNKMDTNSNILRTMVVHHLEFIIRFGNVENSIKEDGKIFSPNPEYLEAWKLAMMPGISTTKLGWMCRDLGMDNCVQG